MYLIVRQNIMYETKTFDVVVELMGIVSSLDEAKEAILEEINDGIVSNDEDGSIMSDSNFEKNEDESLSINHDDYDTSYDIIPVVMGVYAKSITLGGT